MYVREVKYIMHVHFIGFLFDGNEEICFSETSAVPHGAEPHNPKQHRVNYSIKFKSVIPIIWNVLETSLL